MTTTASNECSIHTKNAHLFSELEVVGDEEPRKLLWGINIGLRVLEGLGVLGV